MGKTFLVITVFLVLGVALAFIIIGTVSSHAQKKAKKTQEEKNQE